MKATLLALAFLCSFFGTVNSGTAQLTFTSSTYNTGSGPIVDVADVNGDGKLDLIIPDYNTNKLTVLTNNGNGGFGLYATLTVGNGPGGVISVDVNGDGKPDLITVNARDNTLTVLTNNGSGIFGLNATLILTAGAQPQVPISTDINGDGKPDLITVNNSSPGLVTVFTNNGTGVFGLNATYTVGNNPFMIIAADVNGGGFIDLITANYSPANTLTVLTNNGSGVFGFSATLQTGIAPQWVAAADLNGDGKVDLISANIGTNTLTVFTNNGNGIFGFNATLTVGGKPFSVVAADLNGDGKMDLVCANAYTYPGGANGNTLTVLTNSGSGVFGFNTTLTVGSGPWWMAAADFNGDGKIDLVAANFKANTVTVLMNTTIFPAATNFPKLKIKQQGKDVRVSWPSASPGWSLQQKPDLAKSNWLPSGYDGYPIADEGATDLIADDRTNKCFIFPPPKDDVFFRLIHP